MQMATVFQRLSAGRKISLLLLIGVTIVGCVLLVNWVSRPEYGVLYSDLEPEDAGAILSSLKERKIPFRLVSNGRSVMVPQGMIQEARLDLAAKGLPQGGAVGFELFDNSKLGMTEFAQNVNFQRAMQGELARTINGFKEVESSRVHLVMQPKSLFVEDEKPASASVVLKLRSGKWLNQDQVDGIVHLVSSSIMGLNPENVTVVDNVGKVLSGPKDENGMKQAGAYQLEYREKVEKDMENRITSMLEKTVGADKAIVRVSCLINYKKHEKTEELYYPENQVVRSEQLYQTSNDQVGKDASGTSSVGSADTGGGGADNEANFKKKDRTVNYEIGKVTSHIVEPFGTIEKMSVAVLVDGVYTVETDKKGEETWNYAARSETEMTKFEDIVKRAISYDEKRGDQVSVVNMPFQNTRQTVSETEAESPGWMDSVRQYGGPAVKYIFTFIVAMMIYLFVVRPIVQWVTDTDVSDAQLLQQLPKTVGELEREFDQNPNQLPSNASRLLSANSEKAVQLMRSWMSQA